MSPSTSPNDPSSITLVALVAVRELIEHDANKATFTVDESGRVSSWSKSAAQLYGFCEDEILGQHVRLFCPAEGIEVEREVSGLHDLDQAFHPHLGVQIRKDGTYFTAHISYLSLRSTLNTFSGRLIIVNDLSGHILTKDAALSAAIIDSLPGVFYMYNEQGQFLKWNKKFEEVTGYNSSEIAAAHPLTFFTVKEKPLLTQKIESVFAHGFDEVEADFVAKDGTATPYYFNGVRCEIHGTVCLIGMGVDISKPRAMEVALRQTQQHLETFVRLAPVALAMFDRDMRYMAVSERWVHDFNLHGMPLVGSSHYDIFKDIPDRWKEIHRRALAGEEIREEEDYFERSDGAAFWLRWTVTPWRNHQGQIEGIVIFSEDITRRKKGELALIRSEERLQLAMEGAKLGIWRLHVNSARLESDYKHVYQAQAFANPMTKEQFFERVHMDDRTLVEQTLESAIAQGTEFRPEYRFISPSGDTRWHGILARPISNSAQVSTEIHGVVFDITDRKTAEVKLEASEQRLRLALTAAHMGIFDWDIKHNRITWSRRHEELWGYKPGEFTGVYEDFARRVHPDDLPAVNEEVIRSQSTGSAYAREYRVVWPDQSIHWVAGRGEFEFDSQGQAVRMRGVVTEITERKRLEERYLHAQKMEAIGQLAGGVAHDFNNLLTVIAGHSELALATEGLDDSLRDTLQEILDAARRAALLTRQLLEFSRRTVVQPAPHNLNTLIEGSSRLLTRLVGEGLKVVIQAAPELYHVRVDAGQMGQLLMNLAVNARDALNGRGAVTIRTNNVVIDSDQLQQRPHLAPGKYVLLSFEDDGCGIPPELLPKIFEPFFTTKDVGKGSGLGLSVVYGIVEQSGGFIEVESQVGNWTRFLIYFPAHLTKE